MSDIDDQGLYLEGKQPMDTIDSGVNIFEDILEEETDPLVRISQSYSNLLSES